MRVAALAAALAVGLPLAAAQHFAPRLRAVVGAASASNLTGGTFSNPVINADAPDPGVVWDAATNRWWLAHTSGNAPDAFPLYSSPDLVHWSPAGHIFPAGQWPSWAGSDMWAPEIHHVHGHFVAYFVGRTREGLLSVGAAVATSVGGPYRDVGKPVVSTPGMGMIDPTCAHDPRTDTYYLVWKQDGNAVGQATPIYAAPLTRDGTALAPGHGDPSSWTVLMSNNPASWEGGVVEAPWLYHNRQDSHWYLFYSGNGYAGPGYAVGVARAPALLGPYTKYGGNPVLSTEPGHPFYGPGHCSVVNAADGTPTMVLHAWEPSGHARNTLVARVGFTGPDGWPVVGAGGHVVDGPQPVP